MLDKIRSLVSVAAFAAALSLAPVAANPVPLPDKEYADIMDRDAKFIVPMASIICVVVSTNTPPTPPPAPEWLGSDVDTSSVGAASAYTFAACDLGDEHSQRVIVLNVACGGVGAEITTLTINGVQTTFIHRSGSVAAQQHYAVVPDDASGDIVVTVPSGTATHCWISWYAIYPYDPVPWFTGHDNDATTTDSVVPLIVLPTNGYLVYYGSQGGALGAFGTVWDGTATLTEDVDEQADGVATYSTGHAWESSTYETAKRSLTLQETVSGTKALHLAVWGPDTATSISHVYNTAPAEQQTNTDVFTFEDCDIDEANANRLVVAHIFVRFTSERALTSCTIGGVTATVIDSRSGTEYASWLVAAPVPTGTTADIVVTWAGVIGSSCGCGVQTWSLYNLECHQPYAAADFGFTGTTDASLVIAARNAGSIIVGECSDTTGITHTWSHASERYDADFDAGVSTSKAGADYSFPGATGTHTETVQESGSSGRRWAVGSWR